MLNTIKNANIEDIGHELELINGLLILTDEFIADLPRKDDEERRWKLEVFCQRQNLLVAFWTQYRTKHYSLYLQ